METISITDMFTTQLVMFMDELIDQFPACSSCIPIRIDLTTRMTDASAVVGAFVDRISANSSRARQLLHARDDAFGSEHVFRSLYPADPEWFARVWADPRMTAEIKGTIWRWLDSFVFMGDQWARKNEIQAAYRGTRRNTNELPTESL